VGGLKVTSYNSLAHSAQASPVISSRVKASFHFVVEFYPSVLSTLLRPHRMHEIRTTAIDVPAVCQSVRLARLRCELVTSRPTLNTNQLL